MRQFMRVGYMGVIMALSCGGLLGVPQAFADVPPESSDEVVATLDGFRSARFGMSVKDVEQAIVDDFSIETSAIQREEHPTQKTENLWVSVENLLPESGRAKLYYIFGFESKQLIQINVIWGASDAEPQSPSKVVAIANQLREHFFRKGFQQEGLVMNASLGEGILLVFRGTDARGRMVVLLLTNPEPKDEATQPAPTLRLSYIVNPDNPDIYRIKADAF